MVLDKDLQKMSAGKRRDCFSLAFIPDQLTNLISYDAEFRCAARTTLGAHAAKRAGSQKRLTHGRTDLENNGRGLEVFNSTQDPSFRTEPEL